MERDERQQLRTITDEVAGWVDQARSVLTYRAKIDKAADDAIGVLRRAVVDTRRDGTVEWRALPLSAGDSRLLGDVARQAHQPSMASAENRTLDRLSTEVAKALHDVQGCGKVS